nr:hypothetical protein [Longispora sp. (in: high G+C Gram-positive bacteria)]
ATGAAVPASPGNYTCSFTGNFNGVNGASQTNTVTVVVSDGETVTRAEGDIRAESAATATDSTRVTLTAPVSSGGGGSDLPITGTNAWSLARLGGILLLLGWVTVMSSRRPLYLGWRLSR